MALWRSDVASHNTSIFLSYMSGLEMSDGRVFVYALRPSLEGLTISSGKLLDFGYSLYYSLTTFMAVTNGIVQPLGHLSHTLSLFQFVVGLVLRTIIAGTILRKLFSSLER